ncbi:MBL fold metallo-hydrolase [Camelimonas lactis]|uniref:Phosphoribosyl 1,2-cyclic phosphate phosphodiesterase n=1 Tax=Camelimonas lactis TaxID=659006 RepID=A0A4V2RXF0_9HYPH|nr:MBL fold metallo-hydrolase [Camelimonas lactis]TCO13639.1 phosphoribosyl 1,2-cyclic phosphate phosphodiesterase [Camelimonas lactis]
MSLKVTILGCGSSAGVPRVGQGWGACDPANPKNRRRRCALLVERTGPDGATTVLVDMGPDLREQLLDADVRKLDGILLTHEHADHTHGIDDVRPLAIAMRRRLDVWIDDKTFAFLEDRFDYIFRTPHGSSYPPILRRHPMAIGGEVVIDGAGGAVRALPFNMLHGDTTALGFRFNDLAYASDVHLMPEESVAMLHGLDVLIVDALRHTPHPTHFNVAEALELIARVQPKRAVLTNLHTDLDYATLAAELPPHVTPAFDGMVLETA